MSRTKIFVVYTIVDLLIVAGALWATLGMRWPARQVIPAVAVLFVLNGFWLVVMTIKNTPPGGNANGN